MNKMSRLNGTKYSGAAPNGNRLIFSSLKLQFPSTRIIQLGVRNEFLDAEPIYLHREINLSFKRRKTFQKRHQPLQEFIDAPETRVE